ncbi:MAG: SMP-30/gluconolactonase/LRE family protein [Rhizobiaceae bacterium]|nr:SMP-30/gluconolactonase/LRE family protein [Rhizobiaceae bacterium]
MSATTILSDTSCELGEGPSYEPATDTLWWFDIVGKKLLEYRFANNTEIAHDLPVMAAAIAVVDERRQLIATELGLQLRNVASGDLELVTPIEADNAVTRANDSRVHPSGAFWVGTMGKNAEKHAGAIYWYRAGETRKLFPEVTIPNSICFSPAGDIAYYADTGKNILFRVECDPATGLPTSEPAVLVDSRGAEGGIDGSVCDADGNIWNACWGGARLDVYDPAGKRVASHEMPASQMTCPAFIGRDLDRLAVTSAYAGQSPEDRAADPEGGKTFIAGINVKGRAEPRVIL